MNNTLKMLIIFFIIAISAACKPPDTGNDNQTATTTTSTLPAASSTTTTSIFATTFSKTDPVLIESGANFPGIVSDGERLVVSYGQNGDLFVCVVGSDFSRAGDAVQVTSRGDVTDHKHIYFGGSHYLLFSTRGDVDLYLMKLDDDLSVSGDIVTVTEGSTNTATNDMLLGTDGSRLITGQFRPPDRNNNESSGHLIKLFDTGLNYMPPDITANDVPHTNTAAIGLIDDLLYIVAPSTPVMGGTVQTQRDLILIRYYLNWDVVDTDPVVLMDSTSLTHSTQGDGIWMSTGLAYYAPADLLLVGHTFVNGAGDSDSGRLYLRAFDTATFSEQHSEVMVDSDSANRAHFLLLDDTLYVVYDQSSGGSPEVYGLSYRIE